MRGLYVGFVILIVVIYILAFRSNPKEKIQITSTEKSAQYTSLTPQKTFETVRYEIPMGRFIDCMLIRDISSDSKSAPIIALVRNDFIWDGDVVIPEGTELHGSYEFDRSGKFSYSMNWKMVNVKLGDEMDVSGLFVDANDRALPENLKSIPSGFKFRLYTKSHLRIERKKKIGDF
jgi:hypothetical protein